MLGSLRLLLLLLGYAADALSLAGHLAGLLSGLPVGVLRVHGVERIVHWLQDGKLRAQYRLPRSFEWCVTGPAHRYELWSSFRRLLVNQIPDFILRSKASHISVKTNPITLYHCAGPQKGYSLCSGYIGEHGHVPDDMRLE